MAPASPSNPNPYERDAEVLAGRYESVTFETVHGDALDLVPRELGVGAGSGRDGPVPMTQE
jgi:hypothetical protein